MTYVTSEDRDAMAKILSMMEGTATTKNSNQAPGQSASKEVELAGPGRITRADVDAMSDVLSRLNSLSNGVVDTMLTESVSSTQTSDALITERTNNGVKVGRYQILNKEDQTRLAGKHFFSIYNSLTNDTIADDISLYETALGVVRLLNAGRFANSPEVRRLFEQDDLYSSHRVDALVFKKKMSNVKDISKRDIFESRYQASLDRCMAAKKNIKNLVK